MPIPAAGSSAVAHHLRQIVDNSSAVIYVKDLAGRLQLVNRAFEQLFQRRAEEVLGRTDHELFPAPMADVLRAKDQRVALHGEAMEFEEHVQVGEASRTYLSTKFPLFDDGGRVTAVCGISTDISARKNLEEALRHVALGVSAASSDEVFEAIARYMTRSLEADFAFVSRVNADGQSLTTLALLNFFQQHGERVGFHAAGRTLTAALGGEKFGNLYKLFDDTASLRDKMDNAAAQRGTCFAHGIMIQWRVNFVRR